MHQLRVQEVNCSSWFGILRDFWSCRLRSNNLASLSSGTLSVDAVAERLYIIVRLFAIQTQARRNGRVHGHTRSTRQERESCSPSCAAFQAASFQRCPDFEN